MRRSLLDALRDGDAEVRRQAIEALAAGKTADGLRYALDALGDVDWRVRKEACRVAAELAAEGDAMPALVAALAQGENVGLRNAALEVVARLGPRAAPALLAALHVVPATARKFVIKALGDARAASAVAELSALVSDPDPNVVAAAIESLGSVGGDDAVRALRSALRSGDRFHRVAAADALERIGARVPVADLEPLLDDRITQPVALRVLGLTRDPRAAAIFERFLGDTALTVVASAVRGWHALARDVAIDEAALARVPRSLDAGGRERLVTLLEHRDPEVRRGVLALLTWARDPRVLDAIVDAIADDTLEPGVLAAVVAWGEPVVTRWVSTALDDPRAASRLAAATEVAATLATEGTPIGPQARGALHAALTRALEVPDPTVALAAARGLERWGGPTDLPQLLSAVERGPEDLRSACGAALESLAARHPADVRASLEGVSLSGASGAALVGIVAGFRGEDVIERLQTALWSDDSGTRRAAVAALGRVGSARAVELITFALADESIDVQVSAAESLGVVGIAGEQAETAYEALARALTGAPRVRAAAVRSLGRIGDRRASDLLRAHVRDPHPGVSVAAMQALRALGDPSLAEVVMEALGHSDSEVVKEALEAVSAEGGARVVERLGVGLAHASWDVRRLAAELLGRLGTTEARALLAERLATERDDLVVGAIARILARAPAEAGRA